MRACRLRWMVAGSTPGISPRWLPDAIRRSAIAVCLFHLFAAPLLLGADEPREGVGVRAQLRVEWRGAEQARDGLMQIEGGKVIGVRSQSVGTADLVLGADGAGEPETGVYGAAAVTFQAREGVDWAGLQCEVEADPDASVVVTLGEQRVRVR